MAVTDFITNFQFIIPGLIALFMSLVVCIIITRDTKKIKILLLPVMIAIAEIGFQSNPVFLIGSAIIFIEETFTFGVLSDYISQIRKGSN